MRGSYHVYAKNENLESGYGGYSLANGRPGSNPIYSIPCQFFPDVPKTATGLIVSSKFRLTNNARDRLSEAMNNEIPIPDCWRWDPFRPKKTDHRFAPILRTWKSVLLKRDERPSSQRTWLDVEHMKKALEAGDPMLLRWIFAHTKQSASGRASKHLARRTQRSGGGARPRYDPFSKWRELRLEKRNEFSKLVSNIAKEAAESILNAEKAADVGSKKPQECALSLARKILVFFSHGQSRRRVTSRDDPAPVKQIDPRDPLGSIKGMLEGSMRLVRTGEERAKWTSRVAYDAQPRQRKPPSPPIETSEALNTQLRADGAEPNENEICRGLRRAASASSRQRAHGRTARSCPKHAPMRQSREAAPGVTSNPKKDFEKIWQPRSLDALPSRGIGSSAKTTMPSPRGGALESSRRPQGISALAESPKPRPRAWARQPSNSGYLTFVRDWIV